MLLHIPQVLNAAQVAEILQYLDSTEHWKNGRHSAGAQAQKIKNNLQLDVNTEQYRDISNAILQALKQQLLIQSAALPKHILRPLINCYQDAGNYGNHVDNAIQTCSDTGQLIRTDVSLTLFLSNPEEYEGGELVIEDHYGTHEVKLDAGDAILYPATSLHRVEPVTSGKRLAAFTWMQSMIKDDWQRNTMFNLDMTIIKLRQQLGDSEEVLSLTNHYHNLLRQWGEL
ncbi:Fe2+-dependent dioxygenase [Acinetobacter sp. R933-2]|uniref:Fe2+-dependent dioxygenase n=1 Tax=Acinetobacter sp. R933-2 TaxID=2746728 RepID=UPI002577E798|nr:Fe2+-dependent dioxygenase [Acinetobacter sp. R933-2]MDM1245889.1 Fe2+-dependent dioxygenase [Acinetobacter sp. R933-2]